ncbi:MAG: efflux RND transporter periplasmic adaptor subunit [Victivallales bacterium]|nr:efflux RND transporter periplasmic adaptor subunit [Victivallales bacterium]
MSKAKSLLTILSVLAILGGSGYGYRVVQAKREAAQKARAGKRDMAITVQTGKVGRDRIDEILTFNGDIQPMHSVDLQPKISGRLLALELDDGTPVSEGLVVRKGARIARIDDRELKAQLSSAEASISSAKANIAVAKANLESADAAVLNAEANLEQRTAAHKSALAATESAKAALEDAARELARQKTLIEQNATTQQSFDKALTANEQAIADLRRTQAEEAAARALIRSAEADIQQAKANRDRYEASVTQAEAALQVANADAEKARVNLSETNLYAPMTGVITSKSADPGAMVSSTTTVVNIMAIKQVKVLLSIPVNYLSRLEPGKTKARLRTTSLPGREIACTIGKIYPALEITTRTAQVEIVVENERDDFGSFALKPGMYATVEVLIQARADVLVIPTALPIRVLNKEIVYRVLGDREHVKAVPVKLGVRYGEMVEVLSGLKENDEIVIVGQHRLTDGAPIHILPGNNLDMSEIKK